MPRLRSTCLTAALMSLAFAAVPSAAATSDASLNGQITTQEGAVVLAGVVIEVVSAVGDVVATTASDNNGRYEIRSLPAGPYRVRARLEGFETKEISVSLSEGQTTSAPFDLPVQGVSETVSVRPQAADAVPIVQLGLASVLDTKSLERDAVTTDLHDKLALLPGVVSLRGALSIRGGRPQQSSIQIGSALFVDPVDMDRAVKLPPEALESVELLVNPPAVEFGRFASGLMLFHVRPGGSRWRATATGLIPSFRQKRGNPLALRGISSAYPVASVGGPVVANRLFVAQSGELYYAVDEIFSRAEDEYGVRRSITSFTRVDFNATPSHVLSSTIGINPDRYDYAGLSTFTPPESTHDWRRKASHGAFIDRWSISNSSFLETTVHLGAYDVNDSGHGVGGMVLRPQGTSGNSFQDVRRISRSLQWASAFSHFRQDGTGEHLIKAGVDAVHAVVDLDERNRPIEIRRADGTLAREIDFSAVANRPASATDFAAFVQDHWRPSRRLLVQAGARLDFDGVLSRLNFTPRAGVALAFGPQNRTTISSGGGIFFEATPVTVKTFHAGPVRTETSYDRAGGLLQALRFAPSVDPDLRTARSITWNVAFDHRLTPAWSFRADMLSRRGSHELTVVRLGNDRLALDDTGRSRYLDAGVGVAYRSRLGDLDASYVRSLSRGDLNAYAQVLSWMHPVVDENQYGRTAADLPHRVVIRSGLRSTKWNVTPILELQSGMPYSILDEMQTRVGEVNQQRMPVSAIVRLGIERRVQILKWRPWLGVRINNLGLFPPAEVQNNVAAPDFGQFYNRPARRVSITARF